MKKKPMTQKELYALLRKRTRKNADRMDPGIEARCLEELVILTSDASGFSRRTHEFGIIQFLAVLIQCYDRLIPILEKHRGECVYEGADNILAVFHEPQDAVNAAIAMHRFLKRRNEGLPEAEQFNICVGIHRGKVLRLKDGVYGGSVNVAGKLGEDMAARDEILITHKVADALPGSFKKDYARSTQIGGRTYELYRIAY